MLWLCVLVVCFGCLFRLCVVVVLRLCFAVVTVGCAVMCLEFCFGVVVCCTWVVGSICGAVVFVFWCCF